MAGSEIDHARFKMVVSVILRYAVPKNLVLDDRFNIK
jgi:hypothetical protein